MRYSGSEVFFDRDDIIVSKTNLKGHITYANHTFLEVAGYTEPEVIGKAHNIIRHTNMPRGIFEFFWQTLTKGEEIFAYVVNLTKAGDYYWVNAHVTPSYKDGQITGYHSNRRVPDAGIIRNVIEPLYDELNKVEASTSNRKDGVRQSVARLQEILESKNVSYNEFIASTMRGN